MNSKFMVTVSSDSCKLWQVGGNLIGEVIMIPFEGEPKNDLEDWRFRSCVSSDGKIVVAMRGTFHLEVFFVDSDNDKFTRKDTINL